MLVRLLFWGKGGSAEGPRLRECGCPSFLACWPRGGARRGEFMLAQVGASGSNTDQEATAKASVALWFRAGRRARHSAGCRGRARRHSPPLDVPIAPTDRRDCRGGSVRLQQRIGGDCRNETEGGLGVPIRGGCGRCERVIIGCDGGRAAPSRRREYRSRPGKAPPPWAATQAYHVCQAQTFASSKSRLSGPFSSFPFLSTATRLLRSAAARAQSLFPASSSRWS